METKQVLYHKPGPEFSTKAEDTARRWDEITEHEEVFNLWHLIKVFELKMNRKLAGTELFLDTRISPDTPCFFFDNPKRIYTLLENMCMHGAFFADNGALVLNTDFLPTSENNFVIIFTLTIKGAGIPGQLMHSIFKPEMRLAWQEESSRFPNLCIAKIITSIMGGDIKVNNTCSFGVRYKATVKMEVAERYEIS